MRQPRPVRVIALVVVGMLLAACGAAASPTPATQPTTQPTAAPTVEATAPPPEAGSLTVLSLWGGSERANFLAVIDGFTAKTGIAVQYETARDFLPVMRTRLAAGNPPMIAVIPPPGAMGDFAKEGYLVDLATLGITNMSANYSQAWLDLGTAEGTLYGVAVKANSKSTMWYKPASFAALGVQPPTDWAGRGARNPPLTPVKDIAFFTFPQIDPAQGTALIGGGDLAVAFVDNNMVRGFMAYLSSKDSADIWASTGTISPNKNTATTKYPNPLAVEEAKQVAGAAAFRFDGSDLLPGTLGEQWGTTLQGVIENPTNIDKLLNDFEELAKAEFGR